MFKNKILFHLTLVVQKPFSSSKEPLDVECVKLSLNFQFIFSSAKSLLHATGTDSGLSEGKYFIRELF